MLVELGIPTPAEKQKHDDPQRRPIIAYTHIPDTLTFDRAVDTEAFRSHLEHAVARNRGITNYEGAEALLQLTHPTTGAFPHVSDGDPSWVWSDDADMARFLSEYYQVPADRPAFVDETHWRRLGNRTLAPGVPSSIPDLNALLTNVGATLVANNVGGGQVGFAGTATGSSSTTLTDSSASWTSNQWAGYRVYCTAAGVFGNIISNTATALTVDQWYAVATPGGSAGSTPATTATFIIADGGAVSAWFMGITTTNITPGATDTSLSGEATANGMGRKIAAFTVTSAASGSSITFTVSTTYTYSTTGALTFYALGLFNSMVKADATDTMFWETSFSGSATVSNSGDQLTVTDTVTAS